MGVKFSYCSRGVRSAQSGLLQKRSGPSSSEMFAIRYGDGRSYGRTFVNFPRVPDKIQTPTHLGRQKKYSCILVVSFRYRPDRMRRISINLSFCIGNFANQLIIYNKGPSRQKRLGNIPSFQSP